MLENLQDRPRPTFHPKTVVCHLVVPHDSISSSRFDGNAFMTLITAKVS
jgi:hypothetical protein